MTKLNKNTEKRFDERFPGQLVASVYRVEPGDGWKEIPERKTVKQFIALELARQKEEITWALEEEFKRVLEDGEDTPEEFGGGDDPRIRVRYLLDVFIPNMRGKTKQLKK